MLPFQKCTKCKELKDKDSFYAMHTGYRYRICKKCYVEQNRKRNMEMKRRKDQFKLW